MTDFEQQRFETAMGVTSMGCVHSFGKYDSEIGHYLDELSMSGSEDDSIGTVDDIGYHALLRGPVLTSFDDVSPESGLDDDDMYELRTRAGFIVVTDGQGFVTVTAYDAYDALNKEWEDITSEYLSYFESDES